MSWAERAQSTVSRTWKDVRDSILSPEAAPDAEKVAALAIEACPLVWLIGKVQAGKTSIVGALTQASSAEIGEGYKPCTRTAAVFDFPADAPVIRFLDTRGLGEAGYDPAEDIAFHEGRAHLLLVVMKALDPQQDAILNVVRKARERHPDWPILVAQTTLHDGYTAGQGHALPYPYGAAPHDLAHNSAVPPDLSRSLIFQRGLFSAMPGNGSILFVPIDFTKEGDGYDPREYGLSALTSALEKTAPAGLVAALKDANLSSGDKLAAEAHPHIVGYAAAAAAADAVPAAGAVAVPVVQSKMLHSLARIYEVDWTRQTLAEFGGCLGAGAVSRLIAGFGFRQLAKLIPVYGQTAGAAAAAATSFATTFAIGKAACYFMLRRRAGESDPKGVSDAYAKALSEAFRLFHQRAEAKGAA